MDTIRWGGLPPEPSPQWGYAYHVMNFHNTVKTLNCSIEMTARAIRLSASRHDAQKDRVEQALLSSEGQCLIANNLMERIQRRFDTTKSISEDIIRKRQEAAVKLLTWIACIFLPLSTASSLLSMNSRAKDIGSVWWDWLGIVIIAGLMVMLGYTWSMKSFALTHSPIFFSVHKTFTEAKRDTLKNNEKKHLVHPGVRVLFMLGIFALTLGAVISFLIGMFVRLETGATVLGLSVAAALGLVLAPLLILRLTNLGKWLAQCIRSRSWIWPNYFSGKNLPFSQKRGFVALVIIFFGFLPVLAAFGLILFPVLFMSLFTGSMALELLYRMVQKSRKEGKKTNFKTTSEKKKSKGKLEKIEGMNKEDGDKDIEQGLAA